MTSTPVVTSFLVREGSVLLLRRSPRVRTFRGAWAGVSGKVEAHPYVQALREIEEETGIGEHELLCVGEADPVAVTSRTYRHRLVIKAYLFALSPQARIRLNQENDDFGFYRPGRFPAPCVPRLEAVFRRVWVFYKALGRREIGFWWGLKRDRERSATELLRSAVRRIGGTSQRRAGPGRLARRTLCRYLRPEMAGFAYLARLLAERGEAGVSAAFRRAEARAEAAARRASRLVPAGGDIVTLSSSTLVLRALVLVREKVGRVTVLRSLPGGEGVEMARCLRKAGLSARIASDAAMGKCLRGAAAALAGADGIFRGGDLVHKVGTYPLALAARAEGVPFYCVAGPAKRYPKGYEGLRPLIEGKERFDVTPAGLITRCFA